MQSDKTLATQNNSFLTEQPMRFFSLIELGNKSTKGNNEAKFKNQSTILETFHNFILLKNS